MVFESALGGGIWEDGDATGHYEFHVATTRILLYVSDMGGC